MCIKGTFFNIYTDIYSIFYFSVRNKTNIDMASLEIFVTRNIAFNYYIRDLAREEKMFSLGTNTHIWIEKKGMIIGII